MNIDIGFDPIAFLTSVFAVWFAYTESRKNNTILVKIIQCKCIERMSEDRQQPRLIPELSVLIRNQGLSLHNPTLTLTLNEKTGFGSISVPLKRRDERTGEHSEFARGMVAEFSLKSSEIEPVWRQVMANLEDIAKQNTRLMLYSQGYFAKAFRVGRMRDRLAFRWNQFAYRFNRRFDRQIGEHRLKTYTVFKEDLRDLSVPIGFFFQQVKSGDGQ